jgi:hypothetical protein
MLSLQVQWQRGQRGKGRQLRLNKALQCKLALLFPLALLFKQALLFSLALCLQAFGFFTLS